MALGFSYKLGAPRVVPDHTGNPTYPWFPDAHITVLRHPEQPDKFRMVWGSNQNYFTVGDTPYPEDQTHRENQQPVLDMRCDAPCWHCGGTWLMAMFPAEGRLVGFVHGEDHYKDCKNPEGCAWKHIAVCYSLDNGRSWSAPEIIIRSPAPRPCAPKWGGCGDFCVVKGYDQAYYMYYSGADIDAMCGVRIARSADPLGRPGSWRKWWNESFSEPGLGGREGEVRELGLWGGNPSVTWNAHVLRWLIVWHSWDGFDVVLSSSADMLHWAPAVRLVTEAGRKTWYPTLIGDEGDQACGQRARLYYSDMADDFSDRRFIGRDIVFFRDGEPESYVPSKSSDPACQPQPQPPQWQVYPQLPLGASQPVSYPQPVQYGGASGCVAYPALNPHSGVNYSQQPGPPAQQPQSQAGGLFAGCLAALCCCGLVDAVI